jgi:hypothetical protein
VNTCLAYSRAPLQKRLWNRGEHGKKTRRSHSDKLKAQVAPVALKGDKVVVELAQQYNIHPNRNFQRTLLYAPFRRAAHLVYSFAYAWCCALLKSHCILISMSSKRRSRFPLAGCWPDPR